MNAAKAHTDSAAVQLSYAKILSPINGVIADRSVYPGEIAASGTPWFRSSIFRKWWRAPMSP